MRQVLFLVGFCALGLSAIAQPYTSRLGRFQVDEIRGCAPFTITIKRTDLTANVCNGTTPCLMSFDGTTNCPPNSSCTNVTTFTYNTPGTYKLTVTYQSVGADDITVTVDPNVQPAFDIYTCAGSQVSINITDKTYDFYDIYFNNSTLDKTIPSGNNQTATFNYGSPGGKTIKVQGRKISAANNCNSTIQSFNAVTTLPVPTITSLTAVDASTIQLAYTPQPNIEYKSEIAFNNSTNFQTYQTLYKVSSMTASNLNVDGNYYCFRLGSFDPCANTNVYSSAICSHKFSLATASGSNQLSWQTSSTGISNIQVKRNSSALASVASTTTSYNDNAVICKTNYCYQLVSNYAGGATSTSLKKCGTAILTTTPAAINNTTSVVTGSQVDLSWQQNPAFTAKRYDVNRALVGGTFSLEDTVNVKQYSDVAYGSGGFCYRINYVDLCGNTSAPGLIACPMRLSGSLDNLNNVTVQWSAYKGWNQGVKNYVIQKFNSAGALLQSINAASDTAYVDTQQDPTNQVVIYKITAFANEAGVTSSISNDVRIIKSVNLFYPSAFNPESRMSALNQTFSVRGHFIQAMKLEIFDRWGSLVFHSDKSEPWDGRRDGIAMPDATYVWTAEGTDLAGNSFKKAGTVILIRK